MKTYPLAGYVFIVPHAFAAGERRKRHLTVWLDVEIQRDRTISWVTLWDWLFTSSSQSRDRQEQPLNIYAVNIWVNYISAIIFEWVCNHNVMFAHKIHYVATFHTSRLVLRRISITDYLFWYTIASESPKKALLWLDQISTNQSRALGIWTNQVGGT